jgi:hypothetical protein
MYLISIHMRPLSEVHESTAVTASRTVANEGPWGGLGDGRSVGDGRRFRENWPGGERRAPPRGFGTCSSTVNELPLPPVSLQ